MIIIIRDVQINLQKLKTNIKEKGTRQLSRIHLYIRR